MSQQVLEAHGVKRGDRVSLCMPMVPELLWAMLACARIGAVHSIIFAGFSAEAVAERIVNCKSQVRSRCRCCCLAMRVVLRCRVAVSASRRRSYSPRTLACAVARWCRSSRWSTRPSPSPVSGEGANSCHFARPRNALSDGRTSRAAIACRSCAQLTPPHRQQQACA